MLAAKAQAAGKGPSKGGVARVALLNLLGSNLDMIDVFVDQCYNSSSVIARAYFQVRLFPALGKET